MEEGEGKRSYPLSQLGKIEFIDIKIGRSNEKDRQWSRMDLPLYKLMRLSKKV